jgi:hypothetical protein
MQGGHVTLIEIQELEVFDSDPTGLDFEMLPCGWLDCCALRIG